MAERRPLAWAPNGREITYIGYPSGDYHYYLFVKNLQTGRVRKLAGPVQHSPWVRTGRTTNRERTSSHLGARAVFVTRSLGSDRDPTLSRRDWIAGGIT